MRFRSTLPSLALAVAVAAFPSCVLAQQAENPNPEKASKSEKPKDKDKSSRDSNNGSSSGSEKKEKPPKLTSEQRWMIQIKDQLQANDAEWAVLFPRVERVIRLQREVAAGRESKGVREPRPPREPRPDEPPRPASPVSEMAKALNATLWNPSSPASDIRRQVLAVRDARAKARRELTQSQEELRQLLTYRQEAVLIIMGLLE